MITSKEIIDYLWQSYFNYDLRMYIDNFNINKHKNSFGHRINLCRLAFVFFFITGAFSVECLPFSMIFALSLVYRSIIVLVCLSLIEVFSFL